MYVYYIFLELKHFKAVRLFRKGDFLCIENPFNSYCFQ